MLFVTKILENPKSMSFRVEFVSSPANTKFSGFMSLDTVNFLIIITYGRCFYDGSSSLRTAFNKTAIWIIALVILFTRRFSLITRRLRNIPKSNRYSASPHNARTILRCLDGSEIKIKIN